MYLSREVVALSHRNIINAIKAIIGESKAMKPMIVKSMFMIASF